MTEAELLSLILCRSNLDPVVHFGDVKLPSQKLPVAQNLNYDKLGVDKLV